MEQFVDVVMPQIKEDIVEMVQANPQECISERIVEQIVYVSVLEILEKSVKVESVSPQRRKITNPFVELLDAQIMEFVGGRERSLTAAGVATRRGADRGRVGGVGPDCSPGARLGACDLIVDVSVPRVVVLRDGADAR